MQGMKKNKKPWRSLRHQYIKNICIWSYAYHNGVKDNSAGNPGGGISRYSYPSTSKHNYAIIRINSYVYNLSKLKAYLSMTMPMPLTNAVLWRLMTVPDWESPNTYMRTQTNGTVAYGSEESWLRRFSTLSNALRVALKSAWSPDTIAPRLPFGRRMQ